MTGVTRLTIGFIPLADAAALIVAADRGFAAEEGLQIDLVREVSWSNVRWGQAALSADLLAAATEVFRPDLYEAPMGATAVRPTDEPADDIGAFAGPAFDASDIAAHLAGWPIRRS